VRDFVEKAEVLAVDAKSGIRLEILPHVGLGGWTQKQTNQSQRGLLISQTTEEKKKGSTTGSSLLMTWVEGVHPKKDLSEQNSDGGGVEEEGGEKK